VKTSLKRKRKKKYFLIRKFLNKKKKLKKIKEEIKVEFYLINLAEI
jgi:hypothetical protein